MPAIAQHSPALPRNRILQHALFWICVYFFDVLVFGFDSQNYTLFFKLVLLEMPWQMILAYTIMYWAIPRYRRRRYLETAVVLSIVFLLCSFMCHVFFLMAAYYPPEIGLWDFSKFLVRGFYLLSNATIAVIIKLARLWYENDRRVAEMQNSRLESELKMLKDQVNPHFMFNTLNNLYGLMEKNPGHAREMILGLSRILHYMLHESNHPTVPLEKEMNCIRDYIELEKLRYPGNLSIAVNKQDETADLCIVPLVIFPFVENSFKHGTSETIQTAWINIDFSVYKGHFVFKIENSKSSYPIHSGPNGIGLSNVKRRLELIYQNQHSLQIIDGNESFLVILKIKLRSMNNNGFEKNEDTLSYSGG